MATANIWQALKRCGEIFSAEESARLDDVLAVCVCARTSVCPCVCLCDSGCLVIRRGQITVFNRSAVVATELIASADAVLRQSQLAGTPAILGRITVRQSTA